MIKWYFNLFITWILPNKVQLCPYCSGIGHTEVQNKREHWVKVPCKYCGQTGRASWIDRILNH